MAYIRKNIKILFLLVIPVHFFIAQNSLLNKHTHFYANGIVVTHSHPVDTENGKPIQDHKHTKTEICLFHALNFDYYTAPGEISIKIAEKQVSENYVFCNQLTYKNPFLNFSASRAPPFFV